MHLVIDAHCSLQAVEAAEVIVESCLFLKEDMQTTGNAFVDGDRDATAQLGVE